MSFVPTARMRARAAFIAAAFFSCAAVLLAGPEGAFKSDDIEVVLQFSLAPSGITVASDGSWILSVSQTEKPRARVVKVSKSGKVEPFPTEKISDAAPDAPFQLDAVEGLQLGADGLIWMLDNGRRSEFTPKLIAWNYEKNRLQHLHYFGQPAVLPGSYLVDLVADPNLPFVYLSDPANGADAALIVLDRTTGLSRRVLQGHASVIPDPSVKPGATRGGAEARRIDGALTVPHAGVDAIALDRKGEWLYYAPLRSDKLYRIKTEHLRSADLKPEKLAQEVQTYATKPPATSITLDNKGNVYVGDIEGRAIGVIDNDAKRTYRVLASDPRLIAPDGLCFGTDGKLYFFSRSQYVPNAAPGPSSAGTVSTGGGGSSLHSLYRMKALAPGRAGD